ncbi:S-protein homolog 6-like [Punica granatum]|uniref:S-protein homolog n=2 Tax=Punica granatum TaxID=22663 RepID=A0A218W3H5_PUNGR|nr:S-protein homolog 6-like [Punica granatum]OWM67414.1 hypothetical protein CDL15_Pgr019874 [Punica granatum]PKI74183.1 hypothetical protein CRG98_005421 [Punica granatum]
MGNFSASYLGTTFLLLLAYICAAATGEAAENGPKKVVRIQNDLDGTKLMVHCWSKDDDLGIHNLVKGDYMLWSFRNSWLMDTLFWCTIQWDGGSPQLFAVYKQIRDNPRCSLKCWWSIRRDGAYSFNENIRKYELLYKWKKQKIFDVNLALDESSENAND